MPVAEKKARAPKNFITVAVKFDTYDDLVARRTGMDNFDKVIRRLIAKDQEQVQSN